MESKNLISETVLMHISSFLSRVVSDFVRGNLKTNSPMVKKNSFRIPVIILFLLFSSGIGLFAQTTYYWVGGANASYSSSTSWNTVLGGGGSERTSPANSDILIFDGSDISSAVGLQTGSITANTVITQSIDRLVLQNSADVTLTSGAGRTITVRNGTDTDLIINTFSSLTLGASVSIDMANNSAAAIDGDLAIGSGSAFDSDGNGVLTTVNGTMNNSGTVSGTTARLIFSNGSDYFHTQDGGTIPTAGWQAGSTCTVTGALAAVPGGLGQSFHNLTWNSTSQTGNLNIAGLSGISIQGNFSLVSSGTGSLQLVTTATSRSFSVLRNFIISGGTLALSAETGVGTINVSGNFEMTDGTITETNTGSGAIIFNGTSEQIFSKTLGSITNTINFTISTNAILNFGTSVLDGSSGTFTLSSAATLITANANGISSAGATGSIQTTGRSYSSLANYIYNGISPQITGVFATTPTASSVNNLTINNNTGLALSQSLTVNGAAAFTNGALILNGNGLTLNNTVSTGTGSITGSSTSDLSIVGNNTPGMTLPPVNGVLRNFTLNKIGTTNSVNASSSLTTDISGAASFNSGQLNTIYDITINGSAVCGSGLINASGGTVTYNSNLSQSLIAGTYNNLTRTGTGTANLCNDITVNGNLTISNGVIDVTAANYLITLRGNWTDGNVGDGFVQRAGTVFLNGSALQSISKSSGETFWNLRINNSSGIILSAGNVTVSNTLTMNNGNINANNYALALDNASVTSLVHLSGNLYGGVFRRAVNTITGSYLFPVGTSNYFNSCIIGYTGVAPSGSIDVQFFPADPINYGGLPLSESGINISSHYTDGYWTVKSTTGYASTYDLTLNAEGYSSYTVDQSTRILKRTNNGNWTLSGTHAIVTPPSCKRTLVTGIDTGGNTTIFGLGQSDCISISAHPSDVTSCAGENVGFTVAASGTGLSYRWQRNGVDLVDGVSYSNTGTAAMTVTNISASESGQYRCKITSACSGSPVAYTNSASLVLSSPLPSLGYHYVRTITIDQSVVQGSADLVNFPLLISGTYPFLRTVANGGLVQNSNGYDIVFTDNNGFKLDHQVESYNAATGEFTAWVRMPVLYALKNTALRILYGNPQVTLNPSVFTVFGSDYRGVWHLNDQSSIIDQTGGGNNGTNLGTGGAVNIVGKIGGALDFESGDGDYISIANEANFDISQAITVSAWIKVESFTISWQAFITKGDNAWRLQRNGTANSASLDLSPAGFLNGSVSVNDGAWHYVAGTYDRQVQNLYIDGVLDAFVLNTNAIALRDYLVYIGANAQQGGRNFDGIIDEARVLVNARSASWIKTEFLNQNNPGSFYTLGSESVNSLFASFSACENNTVTYSVPATAGHTYTWSVTGGTFPPTTSNSIDVTWGAAGTGSIQLTEISGGCSATSILYNVTIADSPDPLITGNISVCPGASGEVYSTPAVVDHTYSWIVTGGLIDGSTTGNSIVVDWDPSGTGTVRVTETNTIGGCSITTPDLVVQIEDLLAPVISDCPSDINANTDAGLCTAVVTWTEPSSLDDCEGALAYDTRSHAPGSSFPSGTTTVTYTFTDLASNTSTCSFDVTVSDNQVPTIIPPAPVSVGTDAGICTASGVALGLPVTADNCSVASVNNDAPAFFPVGSTTVTWTVTDGAGNSATATQSVTVADNEPPVAVCQDISVLRDALGNATITAAQVDNGSSDNCGIPTLSLDKSTFTSSDVSPYLVTLTVTDANGNASTCTSNVTLISSLPSSDYYSFQTGNWNAASTWTTDPGGTTGPGTTIPGDNDRVVILSGRTVTMTADVISQNIDLTITDGGILDQSTHAFTDVAGLAALKGSGVLKLSSSAFPSATINTFVTTDGGTTEYNNNGEMSSTQSIYYHLVVRTAGTVTQVSNVTLNGNLDVKEGVFQINDLNPRRLLLSVNGDVNVDNTGSIAVGTGVTNTTTTPTGINGTTGGFLNYYELHSHRIQLFGNFTNDGMVRFTNRSYPVYNSFPPTTIGTETGFATVYFQGSDDNTLTCNGRTDFYNLVVDKGTDQTFKLIVNSSAYNNFRLFGANNSNGDNTAPATSANPNLKKALWIKNGTMVLQGLVVIPSLSEGDLGGTIPSHFFIPANAALLIEGAGVIVLSTADDYREVNGAYGVTAPDNGSMGIRTTGGRTGLSVLGKLQIQDGYLSTRESAGILYWNFASGQFIMNGGTVDAKQFHASPNASSLISYTQTAGTLLLRGRFQRTTSLFTPAGLTTAPVNTARASNGEIATQGSFNITNSGGVNGFSMSGGTIRIFDVTGTAAPTYAFEVLCSPAGINVTGGTVEVIPTTGSALSDADYLINSTAPVYNLIINRASGSSLAQLITNPLVVQNDLTLTSGVFNANNLNITIGGNYSIASGTTYTAGTNTTIFNGSGNQILTIDLAAALPMGNLTIDKPAGSSLILAGTQAAINVSGNFRLVLGTINDGGKTVNISGNIFNSGIHTGIGKLTLNGTGFQTIDGNGIFSNVELFNTNADSAPISLLANMTINGGLTFSNDKQFNINTYNLKFNSLAFISGNGLLRYIKTAGNTGDGGITKVYSDPAAFVFPIGVSDYTPASIGLSAAPATYGSVTVNPVNSQHPNVTTSGRSLTYYWRTRSSGFTLGTATVTHGYTYADANLVLGGDITEDEYVAARFNVPTSTWTKGTSADVDDGGNIIGEPGTGSFLENASFIDGDFTTGDDDPTDPFGIPTIYYSRQSGLWSDVNTWSLTGHTGAAAPAFPGASDIAIIGGQDSIYLATEVPPLPINNGDPGVTYYQLDKAPAFSASLQIGTGSVLDIQNNPGSNFGTVNSSPGGNGKLRLTTRHPDTFDQTYVYDFPDGDFSDFNNNDGTTEFYTINPEAGTVYILPVAVTSYGNVILAPLRGSNLILPNNASTTINGNLICKGSDADAWLAMTWADAAYGTIVAKTVYVKKNLIVQGGSFGFIDNGATAQNIIIDGDVNVWPAAGIDVWQWASSSTNNSMSIGGSLINNSNNVVAPYSTPSLVRFRNGASRTCNVTFFGSNSTLITNNPALSATPTTTFNNVVINKGSTQATTLTINITGTLTTQPNNWLTLQNGTFILDRPGADFRISTTTPFTIPATAGLRINNANNVYLADANSNTNDLLLSGKLTLINGNVYVGPTASPGNNNDIEYSSSGASEIDVQGGNLIVNGQIRRNPLNSGGILKYSQSGGTVTINGQAFNSTNAKLEVLNGGSSFIMSNGTLNIVRGNNDLLTPSSPFGDLYLRPETGSVTGGTILFSQGAITTQNYFLDANIPLNNLTITGAVDQPATVRLLISPLVLNGDMTINTNSVLNANNINVTFNRDLINSPGVGGYIYGTTSNITTFSSSGAQLINGATDFYDLVVNSGSSLTLSNPSTILGDLTISRGNFTLGTNPVSLIGDFTNTTGAGYLNTDAAGYGITLNGTSLQHISGEGYYSRLTLNNALGAIIENDITLNQDITLTQGILDIKKNLVSLSVNSIVQGAPFSSAKMITSDGVFSNVGLRKFFNTGAQPAFLYPIGTAGKYTPALLTIGASSTVGYIRINNINSRHPAILDVSNSLDYYWEVQSSGITGFSGDLELNYYEEDVFGDEPDYMTARIMVPGTIWDIYDGVDNVNNKISSIYSASNNLSGEYTAGITTAFYDDVPE